MALGKIEGLAALGSSGPAVAFHAALSISRGEIEKLLAGDRGMGSNRVRIVAAGEDAALLELPLSAGARLAVESIRRCPFVGACLAMALGARCNDLLVEFVTAVGNAAVPALPPLTRSVHDRVRAAAECLRHQLAEPPALPALARASGLSETSLKRGFRRILGTTVFGYLREQRMLRARDLIQSGEATILEAANHVGYSNPSNFAAAFRAQFGLNPKAYQLAFRRD